MPCFGFVSGHDFVGPKGGERELGFSPLPTLAGKAEIQGLKPKSLLGLNGPTKVVP